MVLWFGTLAALGAVNIVDAPRVLVAVSPSYAVTLLATHPGVALTILGAVFLVLTGAEALYADMGHFGKQPVRLAWLGLVWPALLLNYFGQGALLLTADGPVENPFFALAPASLLPVLVLLATVAGVVASQATISGAFSVTRQAVQLDLLPRVEIRQTSADERGQIYVPAANAIMFLAVVGFVVAFGSSSALSAAYGASVIGAMIITTLLGAVVARARWEWPLSRVVLVFGLFLVVDLAFLAGNVDEDRERRLGAADSGGGDVRGLHHVARRASEAATRAARARRAVDGAAGSVGGHDARARHGRVSREPRAASCRRRCCAISSTTTSATSTS